MKPVLATFIGMHEGLGAIPAFALWNIHEPVANLMVGSTVSENTLKRLGYVPVPRQ